MTTEETMLAGFREAARSRLLAVCKNEGFPYTNDERTPVIAKRFRKAQPKLWKAFLQKFNYTADRVSQLLTDY